jgi:DNA polymerase-3 subunit beta
MEFTVTQQDLKEALDTVKRSAATKTTLPALSCVLVDAGEGVKFTTTNLESYAVKTLKAKVKEAGRALVDVALLSEFISTLPDDQVRISTKGKKVQIECGRVSSNVNVLDPEDFPAIPQIEATFEFDGEVLKRVIGQSIYAAAQDDSRPVLTGMLIQGGDNFTVATADGFRMAVIQHPIKTEPFSVIVPAKTMKELSRVLSGTVKIGVSNNAIVFKMDGVEIGSRLIEGQYPSFDRILPSGEGTKITLSVSDLFAATKNASVFLKSGSPILRLDAKKSSLMVIGQDAEMGDAVGTIDCVTEGDFQTFALNPRYVLEMLSAMGTERTTLCVASPSSPLLILPVGDETARYVLMPMHTDR